jgi:thymidylate kinase
MIYKIVTFEGLPAAGKSTVIAKCKELAPDRTHPLFIDRFFYSAMAYAMIENRREDLAGILDFYEFIKQWPILLVYLDIPTDVILQRDAGRNKWRKYDEHEYNDLRQIYDTLMKKYPVQSMLRLDATLPVDVLATMVNREIYK